MAEDRVDIKVRRADRRADRRRRCGAREDRGHHRPGRCAGREHRESRRGVHRRVRRGPLRRIHGAHGRARRHIAASVRAARPFGRGSGRLRLRSGARGPAARRGRNRPGALRAQHGAGGLGRGRPGKGGIRGARHRGHGRVRAFAHARPGAARDRGEIRGDARRAGEDGDRHRPLRARRRRDDPRPRRGRGGIGDSRGGRARGGRADRRDGRAGGSSVARVEGRGGGYDRADAIGLREHGIARRGRRPRLDEPGRGDHARAQRHRPGEARQFYLEAAQHAGAARGHGQARRNGFVRQMAVARGVGQAAPRPGARQRRAAAEDRRAAAEDRGRVEPGGFGEARASDLAARPRRHRAAAAAHRWPTTCLRSRPTTVTCAIRRSSCAAP